MFFSFLKLHDKRHKKLWFLWNSGFEATRCGCIGGTAFFGNNVNGPKFFKPSAQDIQDGINIARYKYVFDITKYFWIFLTSSMYIFQYKPERVRLRSKYFIRKPTSVPHTTV